MHKIKILDMDQEKEIFEEDLKQQKNGKKKEKFIKINDSLFEIGLRKGLIEKNEDGYYFIGDYEELLAFKNSKPTAYFELLE